jgi:hypothetical protein
MKTLLALRDLWFHPPVETRIRDILRQGYTNSNAPTSLTELRASIRMDSLSSNPGTGSSHQILNITADSPTASPGAWGSLKRYLELLNYPTTPRGPILPIGSMQCDICNSIAHIAHFCPFLGIPSWNGPISRLPTPPQSTLSLGDAEQDEKKDEDIEAELTQLGRDESIYG